MRSLLAVCGASALLAVAGCGDGAPAGGAGAPSVAAASSLRAVLPPVAGDARLSFGGSGELARQITAGAPVDLLLAASEREPAALARAGRCDAPRVVATNRLVLVVPRAGGPSGRTVDGVGDLRAGGLRLALGAEGVPAGDYARVALGRLGLRDALAASRVSEEPDVRSVVSKVALGSADAGIAYATDARAAAGRVRAVPVPAAAQPAIRYAGCVVRRPGARSAAAQAVLARLLGPEGRAALARAGFGLPETRR